MEQKEAFISQDHIGRRWVTCPYCSKRSFLLHHDTKIQNLPFKCKNSRCKQIFIVNV